MIEIENLLKPRARWPGFEPPCNTCYVHDRTNGGIVRHLMNKLIKINFEFNVIILNTL